MYDRVINLKEVLERKSAFLFGPRQTGKSTWLKKTYKDSLYINLLSGKVLDEYLKNPNALSSDIQLFQRKNNSPLVIIDEIQKMPQLLDEVHLQMENNKNLRFILTGSSARKLKRAGTNLLGGRASWKSLFPLVFPELKNELTTVTDIVRRINIGGLPSIYTSSNASDDFDDYINLYLNEEIKAEGFVRNYEGFHRFLTVAALSNSKQINFTQVGSDSQIPPRTVHDYFQILEDTLIGFMLLPFTKTKTRKAVASAKFYLFDTGLTNALLRRSSVSLGTPEFGDLLEQYIITEVRAYLSYSNSKFEMQYWRSTSHMEVDLILCGQDTKIAIEIKSRSETRDKDLKGLNAFCEDFPETKKILVTPDSRRSIYTDGTEVYSVLDFLKELWAGEIC